MRIWPGRPYPLGATWDGAGVNFALFSEHATKVELCLFDSPDAAKESHRIELPEQTDQVWHGYLPDVLPGQLYGYRVHGPVRAGEGPPLQSQQGAARPLRQGDRPRRAAGTTRCSATRSATPRPTCRFDERDSAAVRPAGRGRRHGVHLGRRPAAADALAQDAHLRDARQGLHQAASRASPRSCAAPMPAWPPSRRSSICNELGVTAVELLPVHHHLDDRHLVDKGLVNYWGYNTLGFFAPEPRYAATEQPATPCSEFKMMVRALHAAGIEVILDVVYNHTAEGNQMGPTLSLRGIDNAAYYRLVARGPALLHGLHRLRQHAQHAAPARAAAHHGQPALLGDRDARRRVPLRPGQHAGPRAVRGRQAGRLLRHHPPGPDPVAGQADRRAVGRRPRRLPGRQLPARLDRVERQVPRHRPAVLEGRRRHASASSPPG